MAVVVKRVGEVKGLVLKSPLYWESIELLARDEVSRGIFYALPDGSKLHYLKRKIDASNTAEKEPEPTYETGGGRWQFVYFLVPEFDVAWIMNLALVL
ncbi:unnamed protein product [Thlaspi arvense]|uniref:Uncharacterized protein n=1 Tax=Thlaspi arvense TaxID=13288 RepID=A0AAU9RS79_THLAR|nr:unnamed protein product [Thlaspi arvense]